MRLGLGTGSTARHFVDLLGEKVAGGLKVRCVATSEATARAGEGLGIPMATLDDMPELDLTVDGADEIDPELRLIKGGGGALLREKIVAAASQRMAVIADATKLVPRLGAFPLPVEVVPFGLAATRRHIEDALGSLGLAGPIASCAADGRPFVTDGGHFILDCSLGAIPDPERLAAALVGRSPASSSTACSSAMRARRSSPAPRRVETLRPDLSSHRSFSNVRRANPYGPRSSARALLRGAAAAPRRRRLERRPPAAAPAVPRRRRRRPRSPPPTSS